MMDGRKSSGLAPFVPGDTSTVSSRWKKWKRSFQIFLDVNNVALAARKKSYLLHYVGPQVQDVYFSLQGDDEPEVPVGSDVFQEAMKLLDEYFLPMKCLPLERHKFRNLVQAGEEPIESFVLRLREQGNLCEYGDHLDDEIKEQIFEKGASNDLRARILNKPQMTLAETIEAGRSLETIEKHKNNLAQNPTLAENDVEVHKIRSRTRFNRECYRCGKLGHFANDDNCPAKDRECKRCGMIGHFKSCCKTKKHKKNVGQRLRQVKTGRRDTDSEDSDDSEQQSDDSAEENVQYLFATNPARGGNVICTVGGVPVKWVVDSGAGVDVIDRRTWEHMKKEKVRIKSQQPVVKKTLMSYSGHPVEVAGMFSAEVATERKSIVAEIYVAENGTCCLLGRKTAETLGILSINTEVCATRESNGRRLI